MNMSVLHHSDMSTSNPDRLNWLIEAGRHQNEFRTMYWGWRTFESIHSEYIKTFIGLVFFGSTDVENPSSVSGYYRTYNEERRNIIDKVFEQMQRELRGCIHLSCTMLECRLECGRFMQYPLIRFVSGNFKSVRFFDVTTRCYRNWRDFVHSNSLPTCEYLVPKSGEYEYERRNCIVFSTKVRTLSPADMLALAGNTIGRVLTLVPSVLQAGSGSDVSRIGIQRRSNRSIELPVVSSRSNSVNRFGLMDFSNRVSANEVSFRDAFDFSLHLFQLCGLVVSAQDLHNALCQSAEGGTVNSKLTATQKHKIRTEAGLFRTWTPSKMGCVVIRSVDVHTSLKSFAVRIDSNSIRLLLRMFPKSVIIFEYFIDIETLLHQYRYQGLDIEVCRQLHHYADNVYAILQMDLLRMKQNLRRYVSNPAINNEDSTAQICNNEIDWMYLCAEDITESVFGTFDGAATDSNPGQMNTAIPTRPSNQKLVLDCVKRVCSKFMIDNSSDTFLQYFDSVLTFATRVLVERISQCYNQVLNGSESIVGEEMAKRLASVLGTKNVDDFFPINELFNEVMKKMEPKIETFASTYAGNCLNGYHSALAADVYDSLVTLIDDLFSKVTVNDNIGIEQMAKTLQNVSVVVVNDLRTRMQKMKAVADTLYEENMDSLGCDEIVKELLNSIDVPTDDLEIFRTAVRRLDINEIVVDILQKADHKYAKLVTHEIANNRNEIESAEAIFIRISANFFNKIEASQAVSCWSTLETFKKVVHFIAIKFIEGFQSNRKRLLLLKANLDIVGRKTLKQMLKAINVLGDQKAGLFRDTARIFDDRDYLDQLVPEFIEYYCKNVVDLHQPKIFEVTISEGGFTAYKINCASTESDQYYRSLAGSLFRIPVKATDPVMEMGRCKIVESGYNVVSFSFHADTKETLAILICLRGDIGRPNFNAPVVANV